jgi:hypothetical protein
MGSMMPGFVYNSPMATTRCPICEAEVRVNQPGDAPAFPFCSQRCRTIDLGRWLGGNYRLPAPHEPVDVADESLHQE